MTTPRKMSTEALEACAGALSEHEANAFRAHIAALEQELADARKRLDAECESHAVTKNKWSLTRADCRDLTRERDELQTEVNLKQAALVSAWRDRDDARAANKRAQKERLAALDILPEMDRVMRERDTEREMRTRAEELANANADKANAAEAVCASISASVGFTGPTKRLADAVESAMDLSRKTLTEYQRAERERIAALADNAALVKDVDAIGHMLSLPDGQTAASFATLRILGRNHPGAALLEEHRKAVEKAWTEGTCAAGDKMRERFEQQERDHAKALVRARNEGLEKAAVRFDSTGHFWVSQILRATKEPEQ